MILVFCCPANSCCSSKISRLRRAVTLFANSILCVSVPCVCCTTMYRPASTSRPEAVTSQDNSLHIPASPANLLLSLLCIQVNSALTSLNLHGCKRISDKGLNAVSSLPLRALSLGLTRVKDEGMAYLARLTQVSRSRAVCVVLYRVRHRPWVVVIGAIRANTL